MWRLSSADGKWVQVDAGRVTGSADVLPAVLDDGADPIEVAPFSGNWYTPKGVGDETAVLLRARRAMGDNGLTTAGTPPALPQPSGPATAPPGVVV